MSVLGFIPLEDGYTEGGIFFEKPGLYPRVEFTFRPMTIAEIVDYEKAANQLKGMNLRRLAARCIGTHIKSWDLKDRAGVVLPLDDATVLRLKDVLFNRFFAVVSTQEAPDAAPPKSDEEESVLLADALSAMDQGRSPVEMREEREVKNS